MSDAAEPLTPAQRAQQRVAAGLRRRYRATSAVPRLRRARPSPSASCSWCSCSGRSSRRATRRSSRRVKLDIEYTAEEIDPAGTRLPDDLETADYIGAGPRAPARAFPDVGRPRDELRELYGLLSSGAPFELRDRVLANPALIGTKESVWVLADDRRRHGRQGAHIDATSRNPTSARSATRELAWIERSSGRPLRSASTRYFFTSGDSREPEQAGVWGATSGVLHAARHAAAVVPDRRRGGDLPRGVRAAQPAGRT
jgi:phosphate transport system permease protein